MTTNDPERPRFSLRVEAMIVSSVRLLPDERLYLHNLRGDNLAVTRVIRQLPGSTGTLAPVEVTTSQDWLHASIRRVDLATAPSAELPEGARDGDWLLELRVGEAPAWGLTRAELAFDTGLEPQRRATFNVQVNLRPPVNLSAREVVLDGGQPQTLLMSLRQDLTSDEPRFDVEPDAVQLRVEPFGDRRYKLHLSLDPEIATPPGPGSLTITVDGSAFAVPVMMGGGGSS